MTSDSAEVRSEVRMPRRKWGWIFVALFFVQAIVLGAIIGGTLSEARRSRASEQSYITNPPRNCDLDCRIRWMETYSREARAKQVQANMLMVVAGVCSIVTLVLAIFGLRRRKAVPAPTPT